MSVGSVLTSGEELVMYNYLHPDGVHVNDARGWVDTYAGLSEKHPCHRLDSLTRYNFVVVVGLRQVVT